MREVFETLVVSQMLSATGREDVVVCCSQCLSSYTSRVAPPDLFACFAGGTAVRPSALETCVPQVMVRKCSSPKTGTWPMKHAAFVDLALRDFQFLAASLCVVKAGLLLVLHMLS